MSGCVTVIGPPCAICARNFGITLPVLPSTLPKRTITKRVAPDGCKAWHTSSASRLDAPITLVGLTALSVEISTNFSTPCCCAARATVQVPSTLLRIACQALFRSIIGTCL